MPRSEFRPAGGFSGPPSMNGDHPADQRHQGVRKRLETLRSQAAQASCWHSLGRYLSRLINREGFVPLRVRLSQADVTFLTNARTNMLAFAEAGLRLTDLHQPRAAGGISSDPGTPIRRCRACMWRWPCPTIKVLDEALSRPELPGA